MSDNQICYTYEGALEAAIAMEEEGFRNYLRGLRTVQQKGAREIIREIALDELNHKQQLEKALVEGQMSDSGELARQIPTMNLGYVLKKAELGADSTVREAMVYAMQLEKEAAEFYRKLSVGCAGAPMAELFERLNREENGHLQRLEDLYEKHFMPEN